ncbi:MAG: NADH-quinone oxidoreductase subunit C [Nitrospirae bacterium]|nr:MAG: NADH-quinone oxidoreductase subunit C [Nitrospirota bacterium]
MEPLEIADKIKEKFSGGVLNISSFRNQVSVTIKKEFLLSICNYLKKDKELSFDYLSDLCGCDYPDRHERFEVVYNIRSIKHNHFIRIKVRLSQKDPVIESVTPIWKAADWFEREVYDMFGIRFKSHPDLRRILLPDDWEGNPLKKDYPLKGREEDWKGMERVKELRKYDKHWSIHEEE